MWIQPTAANTWAKPKSLPELSLWMDGQTSGAMAPSDAETFLPDSGSSAPPPVTQLVSKARGRVRVPQLVVHNCSHSITMQRS